MPYLSQRRRPRADVALVLTVVALVIVAVLGAAALATTPDSSAPRRSTYQPILESGPLRSSVLGSGAPASPPFAVPSTLAGSPAGSGSTTGRLTPRRSPLVIAHRGASAYRPENTLSAFRLAINMGADYIEGDVVVTRDRVLVVRHDAELSATTDVAEHPEFADRRTTKRIDGSTMTGWFVEDFTLAEIKTLGARARGSARRSESTTRSPETDVSGVAPDLAIPTVTEMIGLARSAGAARQRGVGLYFELKNPRYFRSIGLALEPLLATVLRAERLANRSASVFVESFDADSLKTMSRTVDVQLVQLIWGDGGASATGTSPEFLRQVAEYASVIGFQRSLLRLPDLPGTGPESLDSGLVTAAHTAGLEVHVYTFEDHGPRATTVATYHSYYAIGVDGVFTDKPDLACAVREG